MNYAVIKTGGKQHIVRANETFVTDKLEGNEGDAVSFDEVLLVVEDGKSTLGMPVVSGFSVIGKIVSQKRGDKVRVGKYKAKSRYRRANGFRSHLTEVMIESIGAARQTKGEK